MNNGFYITDSALSLGSQVHVTPEATAKHAESNETHFKLQLTTDGFILEINNNVVEVEV